jgi:hypothetical protein
MKITPRFSNGTVDFIASVLLLVSPASGLLSAAATDPQSIAPSTTNQSIKQQPPFVRVSPRVAEIVRMAKAHLDPEVIKTYISSSSAPFSPTAEDIVVLKRIGIPEELVTAMLQRDAELVKLRKNAAAQVNASRQGPTAYSRDVPYPAMYPRVPSYNYAPMAYHPTVPIFLGPLTSFNNSFPTFINGQAVYSGYYLPAYSF